MFPTDDDRTGRPFRFDYDPGTIRYGTGCVDDLEDELAEHGFERALVVCGSTVGSTPAVIDPVIEGLGDRLGDVFAETTPEKRLETAYDGVAAMEEADADVLVSLGGGSSLDVAKTMSVLAGDDRDPEAVGRELGERGTISIPDSGLAPIVAIPTTLAGADLSIVAGVSVSASSGLVDEAASGGISDRRLMPRAILYDPKLFATTPREILAGSALNGFDKGIETLYARNATPVTDATAARGLALLGDGLRQLGEDELTPALLEPIVEGTILVQYGIARPSGTTLSVVHSYGHGLRRTYGLQQGVAHAIVLPHVLSDLFERVDGRRDALAAALGVGEADDPAGAIVETVTEIRDTLELPTRLRDADIDDQSEFPAVAKAVLSDPFMRNAPPGFDPTIEEIEAVLRDAY